MISFTLPEPPGGDYTLYYASPPRQRAPKGIPPREVARRFPASRRAFDVAACWRCRQNRLVSEDFPHLPLPYPASEWCAWCQGRAVWAWRWWHASDRRAPRPAMVAFLHHRVFLPLLEQYISGGYMCTECGRTNTRMRYWLPHLTDGYRVDTPILCKACYDARLERERAIFMDELQNFDIRGLR